MAVFRKKYKQYCLDRKYGLNPGSYLNLVKRDYSRECGPGKDNLSRSSLMKASFQVSGLHSPGLSCLTMLQIELSKKSLLEPNIVFDQTFSDTSFYACLQHEMTMVQMRNTLNQTPLKDSHIVLVTVLQTSDTTTISACAFCSTP